MGCAKRFVDPNRAPRICQLDPDHAGACAGPIDPGVRLQARRAAKARHKALEASQRQERARAAQEPQRGGDLSPAALGAAILAAANGGARTLAEALAAVKAAAGSPPLLRVSGITVGLREIRQAAARLARDGEIAMVGDTLIAS